VRMLSLRGRHLKSQMRVRMLLTGRAVLLVFDRAWGNLPILHLNETGRRVAVCEERDASLLIIRRRLVVGRFRPRACGAHVALVVCAQIRPRNRAVTLKILSEPPDTLPESARLALRSCPISLSGPMMQHLLPRAPGCLQVSTERQRYRVESMQMRNPPPGRPNRPAG
jgi:hypothetical protein